MQTVERFCLREAITAVHKDGNPLGFVVIPSGSVVTLEEAAVLPGAHASMVNIRWDQQVISVFLQDLLDRGEGLVDFQDPYILSAPRQG